MPLFKTTCLCLSVTRRLNQVHVFIPSLHVDVRKKKTVSFTAPHFFLYHSSHTCQRQDLKRNSQIFLDTASLTRVNCHNLWYLNTWYFKITKNERELLGVGRNRILLKADQYVHPVILGVLTDWIRSPDRPACSESLYRLSYPGQHSHCIIVATDSGFAYRTVNNTLKEPRMERSFYWN